jgi:hypothetical protein
MNTHRFAALAAALGIVLLAPCAVAQDEPTRTSSSSAADYSYRFRDDPLSATGFDATFPRIFVMARADRATLIRPRTAFVVELLKSVETL